MEILYKTVFQRLRDDLVVWVVIFSVPLVASRHNNIPQRRGKSLPKHIPWSDLDFKIVLSIVEKKIHQE